MLPGNGELLLSVCQTSLYTDLRLGNYPAVGAFVVALADVVLETAKPPLKIIECAILVIVNLGGALVGDPDCWVKHAIHCVEDGIGSLAVTVVTWFVLPPVPVLQISPVPVFRLLLQWLAVLQDPRTAESVYRENAAEMRRDRGNSEVDPQLPVRHVRYERIPPIDRPAGTTPYNLVPTENQPPAQPPAPQSAVIATTTPASASSINTASVSATTSSSAPPIAATLSASSTATTSAAANTTASVSATISSSTPAATSSASSTATTSAAANTTPSVSATTSSSASTAATSSTSSTFIIEEESDPTTVLISGSAAHQYRALLAQKNQVGWGLRFVNRAADSTGKQFGIEYSEKPKEGDTVLESQGIQIHISPADAQLFLGSILTYHHNDGFYISKPKAKSRTGVGYSPAIQPISIVGPNSQTTSTIPSLVIGPAASETSSATTTTGTGFQTNTQPESPVTPPEAKPDEKKPDIKQEMSVSPGTF